MFYFSKQNVLSELDIPSVVQILMNILYEAAMPSEEFSRWPSASWGRVEGMQLTAVLDTLFDFVILQAMFWETVTVLKWKTYEHSMLTLRFSQPLFT